MSISEEERKRRIQARADMLGFFYDCIVELDGVLKLGMDWLDAVGSALFEHGWDLVPVKEGEDDD